MKKTALSVASLALALSLSACGGGDDGPKLNDAQKDLVQRMHKRGTASEKDLTCLVGKVKDNAEAMESLKGDSDLSEQEDAGGEAVAAAWSDCTGKTFQESFGYTP